MPEETSKKRYFKKEKKQLKPKRHKAPPGTHKPKISRATATKGKIKATKEAKKTQFPNILRAITERFRKLTEKWKKGIRLPVKKRTLLISKIFWLGGILIISLIGAILFGWQSYQEWKNWQQAQQEKAQVVRELATWEQVIEKYPTYRDAYFEAAVLSYRLGDVQKEKQYIERLRQIDPNFELINELEKISR